MRPVLLLLCAASLTCAELETLTMSDGRVLVGEVTPKGLHGAKVALLKPKGAVIEISLDDVKRRDAYVEPAVVLEPEPAKVRPAPATKNTGGPAMANLAKLFEAAAQAQESARKAEVAALEALRAARVEFIRTCDLAPVAVAVSDKPTAPELEAAQAHLAFNSWLEHVAGVRAKGEPAMVDFERVFTDFDLERYATFKSAPWALDLERRKYQAIGR